MGVDQIFDFRFMCIYRVTMPKWSDRSGKNCLVGLNFPTWPSSWWMKASKPPAPINGWEENSLRLLQFKTAGDFVTPGGFFVKISVNSWIPRFPVK